MTINNRLFCIMEEKNIKQSDLSSYLGISKSVITNWKKRGSNPPAELLVNICELLDISIEYLLTGKEEQQQFNTNESELLELFKQLPEREQLKVIGMVEEKVKNLTPESEPGKSSTSKVG